MNEELPLVGQQRYALEAWNLSVARGNRVVFQGVNLTLAPGEKKTVHFTIGKDELTYWSPSAKKWVVEPAVFDVWAGEDSTATLHGSFEVVQ